MDQLILNIQSFLTPGHLLTVVYILNSIIALGLIFFDRKSSTATLGWIMILFLLPVFGLILYLVLSQNIARYKIYKLNSRENAENNLIMLNHKMDLDFDFANTDNPVLQKWKNMISMNVDFADSMLTYNDCVQLIFDGREMFEKLCQDIINAKYTIKMEYYILKDDFVGKKIISLLTEKAKQGVKVRLLLDAMGSRSVNESDFADFVAAGGEFTFFFKPRIRNLYINFNYRNHRKLVIIDNEIGYIGGFNIAKEYLGLKKKFGYWRDTQLIIKGNSLISLNERFYLDWRYASGDFSINTIEQSINYSYSEDRGNIPIQIVNCGPESPKEEIKWAMMKMINGAKKSIYIQTPYLVPDEPMIESLAMAARSGIDVKIMIPCMPDHPFVYRTTLYNAGKLIDEGAKIYIYKNGFLHAKTLSVDGEVCTIGSSNFDIRSFRLNFESNAFVYDSGTSYQLEKQFELDMEKSTEYTVEDRANISKWEKFLESISRLLTEVL